MLRLVSTSLLLTCLARPALAQKPYFQQRVDVKMQLQLNDTAHTITGVEEMVYTNNSPDTLRSIYIHLWPNAYSNDRTAYARQTLSLGQLDFYFSNPAQRGYITGLDFKVNGVAASLLSTADADVAILQLPAPLKPGKSIGIYTPFITKLPYLFSRGGHIGQEYFATQFYPKPAVYDRDGWHRMPYLEQGEYYNEFGSYDVSVTVPANYTVLGSGMGETPVDTSHLPAIRAHFRKQKTAKQTELLNRALSSAGNTKTLVFRQANSTDFAFGASKWWLLEQGSENGIRTFTAFYPWTKHWKGDALANVNAALRYYGQQFGTFWQQSMAAVEVPGEVAAGGMEYPGFTTISTRGFPPGETIVHEVGHNWFQGALQGNERRHPWMDEGLNSYAEATFHLGRRQETIATKGKLSNDNVSRALLTGLARTKKLPHYDISSDSAGPLSYLLVAYEQPKILLQQLAEGDSVLAKRGLANYYGQWAGKHPSPQDFFDAMDSGRQAGFTRNYFETQQYTARPLKPRRVALSIGPNFTDPETSTHLTLLPSLGYNAYDKAQLGVLLTNYSLSMPRFEFLLAPAYSTGASTLVGTARIAYNHYTRKSWWQASLSGISYHINDLKATGNEALKLRMNRFVPSVMARFYTNSSYQSHYTVRLRRFQIGEEQFRFDGATAGKTDLQQRYVHQLQVGYQQNRALYPFDWQFQADQGEAFLRTTVTGNYFFNYNAKNQGLRVRVFAGKFFYLGGNTLQNQFATDRYQLTLTGPRGDEDFTYSGYFAGRNRFEGFASQQLLKRDGFFKVGTDLLSQRVGKTDDWLAALNLSSDIPDKWNPLSVLPFRLPLRLYADVGTYAEAWEDGNLGQSRFLYNAGLQLSLLKNVVNVYFPLFYSKVYRDYNKSVLGEKIFSKTISFSIDLDQLQPQKLERTIPL